MVRLGSPPRCIRAPRARGVRAAGALLAAVSLLIGTPASADNLVSIEWERERLSVDADQTVLRDILEAVGRRTGLTFRGLDRLTHPVSIHFSGLSLRRGLDRLLTGINHVVVEERTSRGDSLPVLVLFFGGFPRASAGDSDSVAAAPSPQQTPGEIAEVAAAQRRAAARVLLDRAGDQGVPPGLSRAAALLELERGLARQAALDRRPPSALVTE